MFRPPLPSARVRRALALCGTALALAATLSPSPGPTALPDWTLHAAGFGALAALALDDPGRRAALVILGAALAAVCVGGLVELAQPLVGRDAALTDVLADAAGATLVAVCYSSVCTYLLTLSADREYHRVKHRRSEALRQRITNATIPGGSLPGAVGRPVRGVKTASF